MCKNSPMYTLNYSRLKMSPNVTIDILQFTKILGPFPLVCTLTYRYFHLRTVYLNAMQLHVCKNGRAALNVLAHRVNNCSFCTTVYKTMQSPKASNASLKWIRTGWEKLLMHHEFISDKHHRKSTYEAQLNRFAAESSEILENNYMTWANSNEIEHKSESNANKEVPPLKIDGMSALNWYST